MTASATADVVLRVALPLPVPRLFDYRCDGAGGDAWIGCRVRVEFGRRELVGIVAGTAGAAEVPGELKPVLERIDRTPLLEGELLDSLRWAAAYYHAPLGEVFAAALPSPLRSGGALPATRRHAWELTGDGLLAVDRLRRGGRPHRFASRLQGGALAEDRLDAEWPGWRGTARDLHRRGLARRVAIEVAAPAATGVPPYRLNDAQQAASAELVAALGGFAPFVLYGVTGSGKTEVYLQAIAACLERGRQALVLVPEIGLTPQTLQRFRDRLGIPVYSLHSALADGERAAAWAACARGDARVLVGTRSAIFAPLPEAGLLIVDEEHDVSYKQHEGLRYSARDLALVRARRLDVPVVLGSATPSLESIAHARSGRYRELRLPSRAGVARPPKVRVVDVRKARMDAGMSAALLDAIEACLARGEQALVFRNRRGYAPVLLCHDCGWSAGCTRCDARMTVHGQGRRLVCHHCGARRGVPPACPDCGSLGLQPQGAGTERIEDALAERFPDALLLRVDRQSTRRRNGLHKQLARLGEQPGILVGTQMLAKGHDLPRLSLVCVVGIDEGLFSADFRAPERLAQLLVQVSGRAGRAGREGEVLLQTHHPDHPLLRTLLEGGYRRFADTALEERRAAGFPPYAHLALLRAEAPAESTVHGFLEAARAWFEEGMARRAASARDEVDVLGPLPAPMARRGGRARGQLLLSAGRRASLQGLLDATAVGLHALPQARRVRWSLDVDPLELY